MDAREDPLNARGFQSKHALEHPCEHRTVIGQNGIVPVLKKASPVDFDLFAKDTAAIDAASRHPVDAAVAVIGAAVAILPEGAQRIRAPRWLVSPTGYSLTICTCAGRKIPAPEICDAIRNAATTAGRLISLRN
jgi:hypothetical protein